MLGSENPFHSASTLWILLGRESTQSTRANTEDCPQRGELQQTEKSKARRRWCFPLLDFLGTYVPETAHNFLFAARVPCQ